MKKIFKKKLIRFKDLVIISCFGIAFFVCMAVAGRSSHGTSYKSPYINKPPLEYSVNNNSLISNISFKDAKTITLYTTDIESSKPISVDKILYEDSNVIFSQSEDYKIHFINMKETKLDENTNKEIIEYDFYFRIANYSDDNISFIFDGGIINEELPLGQAFINLDTVTVPSDEVEVIAFSIPEDMYQKMAINDKLYFEFQITSNKNNKVDTINRNIEFYRKNQEKSNIDEKYCLMNSNDITINVNETISQNSDTIKLNVINNSDSAVLVMGYFVSDNGELLKSEGFSVVNSKYGDIVEIKPHFKLEKGKTYNFITECLPHDKEEKTFLLPTIIGNPIKFTVK